MTTINDVRSFSWILYYYLYLMTETYANHFKLIFILHGNYRKLIL
jgi:hypothetical protein